MLFGDALAKGARMCTRTSIVLCSERCQRPLVHRELQLLRIVNGWIICIESVFDIYYLYDYSFASLLGQIDGCLTYKSGNF